MSVMDRRVFIRKCLQGIAAFILGVSYLNALPSEFFFKISPSSTSQQNDPSKFLREIYDEVQGLGRHGNDNFIKREFHLNLDDNTNNKEEQVVVLNHCYSGRETMLLQVTYFETRRKNTPVKYAKMIREIECHVLDKGIEIQRCDYDRTEIQTLLPNILQCIRETKKFLGLIR